MKYEFPSELVNAAYFLRKQVDESNISQVYKGFFEKKCSLTVFRGIVKDTNIIRHKNKRIQESVLEFYRENSGGKSREILLFDILLNAFDHPEQAGMKSFLGEYTCYRAGLKDRDFIKGEITIEMGEDGNSCFFKHSSSQSIMGAGQQTFSHRGPVYALSNRIYLIGIGVDNEGRRYLRPMILRTVDEPKKQELVGMLLTETFEHVPLSCKTVLLHKEYLERYRGSDGELKKRLKEILKNESSSQDIIYGWDRGKGMILE